MKIVFFGASVFRPLVLPYLEKQFEVEQIVDETGLSLEIIQKTKSEIAVLAAFGKILPEDVLNHFKYGILNIHPSLLPKYRGASPVQSAILNGDNQTGVTVMKLDDKMDHGPILAQEKIQILPTDTSESLYQKLFPLGAKLIVENMKDYISGKKNLIEQNHQAATYTKPLTRNDGYIDISNIEPIKFERMVRAYFPWPGVWIKTILNTNEEERIVKFLPDKEIQVEGKKPMSYKDFLNGYPNVDPNLLNLLK